MIDPVTGEVSSPTARAQVATAARDIAGIPMLRGWSHAIAIVPAVVGLTVLLASAPDNPGQRASFAIYGSALVLLFTVSTLYHRGPWSPRVRAIWRRVDHANIFLMIAATYTAVAVNLLDGGTRIGILVAIWVTAGIGMVIVAGPLRLPRPLLVLTYFCTGWMAIVILPALVSRVGAAGLTFLLAGGGLYSLGALAYALRRPRLWPRVFGYHEVFHLLVIAATALFFAFIALAVMPAARA
jgi:hemolysin III